MLKVHAIDSGEAFERIAQDYDDRKLLDVMMTYIRRSLEIKKHPSKPTNSTGGP